MIHSFSIGAKGNDTNGSRNLILDVGSGSLHQVDDATLEVLQATNPEELLNTPVEDLSEIQKEIRTLIENQQLFTPDSPSAVDAHMQNRKPVIKALCLHMAHDCN